MRKTDLAQWQRYFHAREQGKSITDAAKAARFSLSTAQRFERGDQASPGIEAAQILGVHEVAGLLVGQPLTKPALDALRDFAAFRLRYFGRTSTPWQVKAAYEVVRQMDEARDGSQRRYIVMNEPPGSGKSTLFTHDLICWLIARDRTIRIMIGSRTERQARMYVGRIKRTLERDVPLKADADSISKGIADDAESTLAADYGAFKPPDRTDRWANNELVVRQINGIALDDKESTVSAWGQDSGFLGGRFDLVVWDDLVDRKNTRTQESRDGIIEWWDAEAETRIEPGGVLLLQGQRIAPNDLYRYCLDKKNDDDTAKYVHVMFKAHDDDLCTPDTNHEAITEAWPHSCLLDPHRLPWKFLTTNKRNNPRAYALQYQQEDHYGTSGLVRAEWIEGGTDHEGYEAPGCLDRQRIAGDVPAHLTDGRGFSFVTVDPSPTKWWGVIWWVYDRTSENLYAIKIIRKRMSPQDFLTLNLDTAEFEGLLTDLRTQAIEQQAPITHIVVEINAAQRWLLQQPHIQKWSQHTGILFLPHSTHANKADPKYGVESLGDPFRQGRIRLPYNGPTTRDQTTDLVDELLRYPNGDTDDLVMSTWFARLTVVNHGSSGQQGLYRKDVPKWLSQRNAGLVRRGLPWAG